MRTRSAVETGFLDDERDPVTAWLLEHTEPFYQQPAATTGTA